MECFYREDNTTINGSFLKNQAIVQARSVAKLIQDQHPVYLQLWEFEKRTDQKAWTNWYQENWYLAPLASIIYLVTIFSIRRFMESTTPFQLRKALLLWNAAMAIFSIMTFFRLADELQFVLRKQNGVHASICLRERYSTTTFWGVGFAFSKIVELGDTIFIVLRKQPLIFLHYYHHATVLCYYWLTAYAINSTCLWQGVMNCGVHSVMYSYYGLKALQVKIPRSIAMTITFLQLTQMMVGLALNIYVLFEKYMGRSCSTETSHAIYALLMYASYFFLFAKYFHGAYLSRQKRHNNLKSQ